MKNESAVNAKCRDLLRGMFLFKTKWKRIEDASGELGTADTLIGSPAGVGWIELKHAGPNAKPNYRPGQQAFLYDWGEAGIPAHTLIGSPNGRMRLLDHRCLDANKWRDHMVIDTHIGDKDQMRVLFMRCMMGESPKNT